MPTEIPDTPQTRTEQYLAAANGQDVELPDPMTREEAYLYEIATKMQGGGSSVTVEPLTVTENGVKTAPAGKAYSPVTVAVPGSKQIATGTFTPASATGAVTLPHDLGVVPDMIIAFNTTNTANVSGIKVIEYYKPYTDTLSTWTQTGREENTGAISIRRVQNGETTNEKYGDFRTMNSASAQYVENVTAATVYFTTSGTAYNWEAGATYRWYAFKFPTS